MSVKRIQIGVEVPSTFPGNAGTNRVVHSPVWIIEDKEKQIYCILRHSNVNSSVPFGGIPQAGKPPAP